MHCALISTGNEIIIKYLNRKHSFPMFYLVVLLNPWVDRIVAFISTIPFFYYSWYLLKIHPIDLARIALLIALILTIVPNLIRRPPVRITNNILFWIIAFFATYWGPLTLLQTEWGKPLVPKLVSDAIALISLAITVWARLSLGRNKDPIDMFAIPFIRVFLLVT